MSSQFLEILGSAFFSCCGETASLTLSSENLWGVLLALALLVTWVFADHHDVSVAANNLALVADGLNAGVNLHFSYLFRCLRTCTQAVTSQQSLFVAINDTATSEVVWAQLYDDLVLGEDSDVVLAHLARNVGKYLVSVG